MNKVLLGSLYVMTTLGYGTRPAPLYERKIIHPKTVTQRNSWNWVADITMGDIVVPLAEDRHEQTVFVYIPKLLRVLELTQQSFVRHLEPVCTVHQQT